MERDELINNFSFKSAVKTLKKKYPFIKDVIPSDEFEEDREIYDAFYVVDLVVDGEKFFREFPQYYEALWDWFKTEYEKNRSIRISFNEFYTFDEDGKIDLGADDLKEEMYNLVKKKINSIINSGVVSDKMTLDRALYPYKLILEK